MPPNVVVVRGKGDNRISTPEQVVILLLTSGLGKGANWCVAYLRNHTFPTQTQGYCSGDITVNLNIPLSGQLLAPDYLRCGEVMQSVVREHTSKAITDINQGCR